MCGLIETRTKLIKEHCQGCLDLKCRAIDGGSCRDFRCDKTGCWFCINEDGKTFREWSRYAFKECEVRI